MIIIVMFYFDCESLKLYNFSLELSKLFYLWKDVLKCFLNLTGFMDLLLENYIYDKSKVRIIVINYQIVNQIFRIQQHCRTAIALQTCRCVLNWTSDENTYHVFLKLDLVTHCSWTLSYTSITKVFTGN